MAAHSSSSKGRKNLDIQDKMKIIEDFKLGKSISDICTEFDVSNHKCTEYIKERKLLLRG